MRRSLPSLSALESFEAVARVGQVTRAAEELGRTQSAVSRQIANLEAFVRRPLFTRDRKRLVLNEAGQMFQAALARILSELESEVAELVADGSNDMVLSVGVLPTFGSRWLIPRVPEFAAVSKGVQLNLITGLGVFELEKLGLDLAIQHGTGVWPGQVSHHLLDEEIVAVASPQLAGELHSIDSCDWLQMTTRPWSWDAWLQARHPGKVEVQPGVKFENFSMLIEAACQGLGVAVLPTFYIQNELLSGRLVTPFGSPVPSGRGYYLVHPERRTLSPKVLLFRDWILKVAGASGPPVEGVSGPGELVAAG